ncbi:MAG TPA: DUF2272 domain-containing protein [Stellaceae bacterium]|jgi:hypothetical protein|nr:DUF2272 domain-containing protein [Stellaceae bacterium]
MRRRIAIVILAAALAGCATSVVPDFAGRPYVPFNREDAVAIALREWRLFGSLSDEPGSPEPAVAKPERAPGLWERVGEYWWLGLGGRSREARWTGKHDENGRVFPPMDDERYAWSAAFISYVMRIAGAGDRFPYAPNHATYVNAAASGRSSILIAHAPQAYAPNLGDLLCLGREWAAHLSFSDLPTKDFWPGHCAIVVARQGNMLSAVGGNEDDAVTMDHIAVASDGTLTMSVGHPAEWPIVIEVRYDAESEPDRS